MDASFTLFVYSFCNYYLIDRQFSVTHNAAGLAVFFYAFDADFIQNFVMLLFDTHDACKIAVEWTILVCIFEFMFWIDATCINCSGLQAPHEW